MCVLLCCIPVRVCYLLLNCGLWVEWFEFSLYLYYWYLAWAISLFAKGLLSTCGCGLKLWWLCTVLLLLGCYDLLL